MDSVEQLFKSHYAFVCQVIYRYVRDRSLAEDIAQDIFTELWQKRGHLQIHTSPQAYLRRMAVTRTLNYLRNSKKYAWEDLDEGVDAAAMPNVRQAEVVDRMEASDLQERLNQAIHSLPEKCRVIFLLSRREEMSYAGIAEHLGISVKTVENQVGKALRLLRLAVEQHRGS